MTLRRVASKQSVIRHCQFNLVMGLLILFAAVVLMTSVKMVILQLVFAGFAVFGVWVVSVMYLETRALRGNEDAAELVNRLSNSTIHQNLNGEGP